MKNTMKLALSAMFIAVMLVLGYIESLFSLGPVPGIKVGLSNGVLLLSLYWLGIPTSVMLMLGKVVLSGILFGNPMAMQYSLAGGVLSMIGMSLAVYAMKGVSPIGAGILGGVLHNVGQVALAMIVLETLGLLYYMAILVAVGAAMGAITGTVAKTLMRLLPHERRAALGLGQAKTSAEERMEQQAK
ncbi:MAG: Gx transporter family protein [Eubacteriales bacterium]|nr:Gx transporter family protein [Eubacteriales bacterium]